MGIISTLMFFSNQEEELRKIQIDKNDIIGTQILFNYFNSVKNFMKNKISDEIKLWEKIENEIDNKDLYSNTLLTLENYLDGIEPKNEELQLLQKELGDEYYIFADKIITKNFNA